MATITFQEHLARSSPEMQELYAALGKFTLGLGPDVWESQLKFRVDFNKGTGEDTQTVASVHFVARALKATVWDGDIDPEVIMRDALTALERRDFKSAEERLRAGLLACENEPTSLRSILIRSTADLESLKPLLRRAYDAFV